MIRHLACTHLVAYLTSPFRKFVSPLPSRNIHIRSNGFKITKAILILALVTILLPTASHTPQSILAKSESVVGMIPDCTDVDIGRCDDEIIYIDEGGVIRVYDPNPIRDGKEIQWSSPEGNYTDLAVGDFNNDKDFEIVAISKTTHDLVVFDPVISSGSVQETGKINEIPWAELYRVNIGCQPSVVGAGNLDNGIVGDEIIYSCALTGTSSRVVVLKPTTQTPDGTTWQEHVRVEFGNIFDVVAVGNIDGVGSDEVVFVDQNSGRLAAYRVDNAELASKSDFYANTSSSKPWRDVVVGQVSAGGKEEVVAIRKTGSNGPDNAFLFQYDSDEGLQEGDGDSYFWSPRPQTVFLANITGEVDGENDDEIIFLRSADGDNSIRMFIKNRGSDKVIDDEDFEQTLDSDNEYEAGIGGDVDGDGKDEIIIIRNDNIRIYQNPHNNMTDIQNRSASTDKDTLEAADLDRNGFISGPQFLANPERLEIDIRSGAVSGIPFNFSLESGSSNVPFTAAIQGNSSWIRNFAPTFGQTPSTFTFTVDASGLMPGTYTAQIIIDSSAEVLNKPYTVEVVLNVFAATVTVTPPTGAFVSHPCGTLPSSTELELSIGGTLGISYTAGILDVPTVTAARQSLAGPVVGGEVTADGKFMIQDGAGNSAMIELPAALPSRAEISASGVETIDWPAPENSWVTASSGVGKIEDILTLNLNTSVISGTLNSESAMLIVIADPRAGVPPENVRFVPLEYVCADSQILLPTIRK